MPFARSFFTEAEQKRIVEAIAEAEMKTSGEIRLHLENFCFGNELKRAEKVFLQLGMQQTAERNGILIYIAVVSHKIAVFGDKGIHEKVGQKFWEDLAGDLVAEFRAGRQADVLCRSIIKCGERLGQFFPGKEDDKNELSNNISFR